MTDAPDSQFPRRLARIEALIGQLEQCPDPAAAEAARGVVAALLELHGAALGRIVERLAAGHGEVLDALAEDDLVAGVLLLHERHPWDLRRRVERAVRRLAVDLEPRGGSIELLEVGERAIRVRVDAGGGCGSSAPAIADMVERALCDQAPDVPEIDVQSAEPAPQLVQLNAGGTPPRAAPAADG